MKSANKSEDFAKIIEKTSPLYGYWCSEQKDKDEQKRLKMCSKDFPASGLFKKEPYKWEILYQSIIREIRKGDQDSVRGLRLLIRMLRKEEQNKVLQDFSNKNLFSEEIISKLTQEEESNSPTKKKLTRFIRILFAIFTNPYSIEIKRKKSHIYEKTGSTCNSARKIFRASL